MSPFLGEFFGTMLLILLGNGVVAGVLLKGTKAEGAGWMVIAFGWGLAVTFAIYAVGNFSGAHLNPALTIALAIIGKFPWENVPMYILAQILGAMLGAAFVWIHYLPHWGKTTDAGLKLAAFSTGPAIRKVFPNMISEMIGTFILVMGILTIGANKFTDGLNPLVIGALIISIGLSLGATTGYALNPARDLGPRIAHFLLPIKGKGGSDWTYAWIPIAGPILGGILGAMVYEALFVNKIHTGLWIAIGLAIVVIIAAIVTDQKEEK